MVFYTMQMFIVCCRMATYRSASSSVPCQLHLEEALMKNSNASLPFFSIPRVEIIRLPYVCLCYSLRDEQAKLCPETHPLRSAYIDLE